MLKTSRFWAGITLGTSLLAFVAAAGVVLAVRNKIPLPGFLGGGTVEPEQAIDVISERLLSRME